MAGSAPFESLPVFLRAAEGVGVLLLVIVFIAAGSLMNRKVPRMVRNSPRVSRTHGRAV
jgi:hypothetical protein